MRHYAGTLCLLLLIAPVRAEPVAGSEKQIRTRTWNVRALTAGGAFTGVDHLGITAGFPGFDDDKERPEANWGDARDECLVTAETLVDLVRSRLATPGFWVDSDASVTTGGGRLVVRAPGALLEKVDALVADVWHAVARRVTVDVRLVSLGPAAVDALEKTERLEAVEDGRLSEEDRRALLALARGEGSAVETGTIVVPAGRLGATGPITTVSYVMDFDVEIAQGSIVGDPIVQHAREGWRVHARPHLLSDGSILLESLLQRATLERPMRRVLLEADALGTLDLPAVDLERAFACSRLRPGESRVVAARRSGRSLRLLLLTPRIAAVETPLVPVSALSRPRAGYRLRRPSGEYAGHLSPALAWSPSEPVDGGADLGGILERRIEPERVDGPEVVSDLGRDLLPRKDAAEAVRRILGLLEQSSLRTWRVRVRIREGGDPDVTRGRLTHGVALDVSAGRSVCLQAGVERSYVADWDVEVAQEARVGDPNVASAFGGLALSLRVEPTPRADRVAVRLDLALSALEPDIETVRSRNAVTGIIEVPRLTESRLERDLVLTVGSPTIVDVSADGGPRRVVEILVEERP